MRWQRLAIAAALLSALMGAAMAQTAPPATASPGIATETPKTERARRARAPRQTREPTAGQLAARERQKKCGAEWREAKAAGKTEGLKWPQYWSKCNARMKGMSV